MIDQVNNLIDSRVQASIFSGLYRFADLMQCFNARVIVGGGVCQTGHAPDVVNSGVSRAIWLLLKGFQSPQYFCLHYQHGFQHFLCVVFSHVVFLLLVDGVATATLAGGDVAFYSREVAL